MASLPRSRERIPSRIGAPPLTRQPFLAPVRHPAVFRDVFLVDPAGNIDFVHLVLALQSQPVFREAMTNRPLPPHLAPFFGTDWVGLPKELRGSALHPIEGATVLA